MGTNEINEKNCGSQPLISASTMSSVHKSLGSGISPKKSRSNSFSGILFNFSTL